MTHIFWAFRGDEWRLIAPVSHSVFLKSADILTAQDKCLFKMPKNTE